MQPLGPGMIHSLEDIALLTLGVQFTEDPEGLSQASLSSSHRSPTYLSHPLLDYIGADQFPGTFLVISPSQQITVKVYLSVPGGNSTSRNSETF